MLHTGIAKLRGEIEFAAGDARAAEQVLRPACEALDRMGDMGHLVSILPYLADALYELGRIEEIAPQIAAAAESVIDEDMDGQVGLRRARAKLHASRGDLDEAERVAREALAFVERTDYLPLHCAVLRDLARILLLSGRQSEAAAALETALALHERKGSTGHIQRVRAQLVTLRTSGC
jgi:tetratricopeptide (TPR) repeat protein